MESDLKNVAKDAGFVSSEVKELRLDVQDVGCGVERVGGDVKDVGQAVDSIATYIQGENERRSMEQVNVVQREYSHTFNHTSWYLHLQSMVRGVDEKYPRLVRRCGLHRQA